MVIASFDRMQMMQSVSDPGDLALVLSQSLMYISSCTFIGSKT
jgi:hypothetical protein